MLINIRTRIACRTLGLDAAQVDAMTSKFLPDQYLLEYKTFFRLLSYYLPMDDLKNN